MLGIFRYASGENIWEPWSWGQRCAQMMVCVISKGDWITAFQANHHHKYVVPTVEGVDFPNLGFSQAWNDWDSGTAACIYSADAA